MALITREIRIEDLQDKISTIFAYNNNCREIEFIYFPLFHDEIWDTLVKSMEDLDWQLVEQQGRKWGKFTVYNDLAIFKTIDSVLFDTTLRISFYYNEEPIRPWQGDVIQIKVLC